MVPVHHAHCRDCSRQHCNLWKWTKNWTVKLFNYYFGSYIRDIVNSVCVRVFETTTAPRCSWVFRKQCTTCFSGLSLAGWWKRLLKKKLNHTYRYDTAFSTLSKVLSVNFHLTNSIKGNNDKNCKGWLDVYQIHDWSHDLCPMTVISLTKASSTTSLCGIINVFDSVFWIEVNIRHIQTVEKNHTSQYMCQSSCCGWADGNFLAEFLLTNFTCLFL